MCFEYRIIHIRGCGCMCHTFICNSYFQFYQSIEKKIKHFLNIKKKIKSPHPRSSFCSFSDGSFFTRRTALRVFWRHFPSQNNYIFTRFQNIAHILKQKKIVTTFRRRGGSMCHTKHRVKLHKKSVKLFTQIYIKKK